MKKAFLCIISVLLLYGFAIAQNDTTAQTGNQAPPVVVIPETISPDLIENKIPEPQEEQLHARSGCCSHHGGVAGCDSASGMIKCNDGTLSPSCTCSGY